MSQPTMLPPPTVTGRAPLRVDVVTTFGLSQKYRGFPEYQQVAGLTRANQAVRGLTYAAAGGEWGANSRETIAGAEVVRVPRRGWWAPGLARAIAARRPDVVHTHHWSNQFAYAAGQTCRALGIPHVITPHGLLHDRFLVADRDRPYERPLDWSRLVWRWSAALRLALRTRAPRRALRNYLTHQPLAGADLLVALSRAEADLLQAMGIPPARVRVIPNGIDLDWAEVPDADAWRGRWSAPLVLFIGQLKARKGWDLFLRAAPGVLRAHPSATFIIVTHSATEPPEFQRLIADLGLGARVEILRRVGEEEKARLFRAADVLCLPTRYEGFGLPVAEAMAAGCPVVTTRLPVIDEMVTDDHDGVLTPYDDPDALARALADLLADAPRRRRLAANGRVTVRRFAIERVVEAWLAAYHDLRERRRGAR